MRTTVKVDTSLLNEAMQLAGRKTSREVIELALKEFVRGCRLRELADMAGTFDLAITVEEPHELRAMD